MPSSTETAAQTYVAAWQKPDAAARARLIDTCFAAEGRIVSRGSVIRGRAALALRSIVGTTSGGAVKLGQRAANRAARA